MIGIITARSGSKGIINKNLKKIEGYSLLEWSIISSKNSNLNNIYLSTDSAEMVEIAERYEIKVIERPRNLSDDNASSIDVIKHASEILHLRKNQNIMIIQPTSPFRNSKHINDAINIYDNEDCDSLISVEPTEHCNPHRMVKIYNNRIFPLMGETEKEHLPRQALDKIYLRNGAIYITNVELLYKNKIRGDNCIPYEMDKISSINIDIQDDLDYARFIAKKINLCPL